VGETPRWPSAAPPAFASPNQPPTVEPPPHVMPHPESSVRAPIIGRGTGTAIGWVGVIIAATAAACALGAAVVGAVIALHIVGSAPPAPHSTSQAMAFPEERMVQTMDLCTRFAVAESTITAPVQRAADVVPAADYLADALREDVVADGRVRTALTEALRQMRNHAAALSRAPAEGAVQPVTDWTAAAATAADDHAWSSCRAYHG
jgi:hypothetical protein